MGNPHAKLYEGTEKIVAGNQGGTPLTDGEYLLKVTDVMDIQTQKKGRAFIVEFEVLETSDPVNHPVTSKRSWYQSMVDQTVGNPAAVKFMQAALGFDAKEDAEYIKENVAPQMPLLLAQAAFPPYIDTETGKPMPGKVLNGKAILRATVRRKKPSNEKIMAAKLAGAPEPDGFPAVYFSPKKKSAPQN